MTTFICHGTPPHSGKTLGQIIASKRAWRWAIHSKARAGDYVLLYFSRPRSALVASGIVAADARKDAGSGYSALIHQLELLSAAVTIDDLRQTFHSWRYWKRPQVNIQVPEAHSGALWSLLDLAARRTAKSAAIDESIGGAREGDRRWKRHVRERSSKLRNAKVRQLLANSGSLACQACDFDFAKVFGEVGDGFCEVHHNRPLSGRGPSITRLRELTILCSNCHRMIHRTEPMMRVVDFRREFFA